MACCYSASAPKISKVIALQSRPVFGAHCIIVFSSSHGASLANKNDYIGHNTLCLYFSTKWHLLIIDLVLAFVLFIFVFSYICIAVFLCCYRFSVNNNTRLMALCPGLPG